MSNQPEPIQIPNLGGLITEDDLYYKGKVPYCSWAKTAQRIRVNAPNWFFALKPDSNEQIVWMAPDNTGYIMGYFQNVETGIKLPLYVYSISNNYQKGIKYDQISTTDIQKAHRRCLCACACYSFGDAFELWAGLEVKESKEVIEEPEENYLLPEAIHPAAKDLICQDIRKSGNQEKILKDFKEHFNLKVDNVRPENITLSEHGKFLRQTLHKYENKN